MTQATKLGPITRNVIKDNSDNILQGFWENIADKEYKPVDPCNMALNLVKRAENTIIIYSPYILYPELQLEIEKAAKRNVRTYAISRSIQQHEKAFQKGLMREQQEVDSTFISVDHKTKKVPDDNPARDTENTCLWFPGELSQRTPISTPVIKLTKEQTIGFLHQFNYLFWGRHERELFDGYVKEALPRKPTLEPIPSVTNGIIRYEEIIRCLQNEGLKELWVNIDYPEDLRYLWGDIDKICFEINEDLKKENLDLTSEILGSFHLPFSYLRTESQDIIYRKDFGIILEPHQTNEIKAYFQPWPWAMRKRVQMKDIRGKILIKDSSWNEKSIIQVLETKEITLKPVTIGTMKEWVEQRNDINHPEINTASELALKVKYSWVLSPPSLPTGAKKSGLYGKWQDYQKYIMSEIEDLSRYLSVLESEKQSNKNVIDDIKSQLETIVIDPYDLSTTKLSVSNLVKLYQALENEIKTQRKSSEKQDELESLKPNRIESVYQEYKMKKFDYSRRVPEPQLPRFGTLFEKGDEKFIGIEKLEEFPGAHDVRNKYNAEVVAVKIE